MLSPSFPPVKSRTTRLRPLAPCARARSERNAGAAKLNVNAATPFLTKSRRVIMRIGTPGSQGSSGRDRRSSTAAANPISSTIRHSNRKPTPTINLDGADDELDGPGVASEENRRILELRRREEVRQYRLHHGAVLQVDRRELVDERRGRRDRLADEEAVQLRRDAAR